MGNMSKKPNQQIVLKE